MIPHNATVIRKRRFGKDERIGIEQVKPGDLLRTITTDNGDFSHNYVRSIVKVVLPRYEIYTSCLDTISATEKCQFLTLDGLKVPWNPSLKFDRTTRFLKRPYKRGDFLLPFVRRVIETNIPTVFYDIVLQYEGHALLVDDYAKVYNHLYESKLTRIEEIARC